MTEQKSFLFKSRFLLLSLLLSAFVYVLHFTGERNSMFNTSPFAYNTASRSWENAELETDIQYRDSLLAFSKRKMNTEVLTLVKKTTGISKSLTFVVLNFIYLVLSGVVIARICRKLFPNPNIAYFAIGAFYLNFTILYGFFAPLYSFDDWLQYLALLIAFLALLHEKVLLFFLFYTISILTRESSVFVAPLLIYYLYEREIAKKWPYFLAIAVAFLAFFLYLELVTNVGGQVEDVSSRMNLLYRNFSDLHKTIESLYSWIMIFGVPLVLSFNYYRELNRRERIFLLLFWAIVAGNTALVYLAGGGRESRLMNIPVILFLPFLGKWLHAEFMLLKMNLGLYLKSVFFWIFVPLSMVLSYKLAFLHKTSIGWTSEYLFKIYFFGYFNLSFFLLFQGWRSRSFARNTEKR